ncbi:lipopolysaccharide transport system permease protein [Pseudomonas sp. NFPP10]|nr:MULTISPECIES: ABC transporter permease [Pseudomonas]BCQ59341.1 transport permease protein [Pseudomonas sp. Boi14]MBP5100580.1 ABC transporter permease [Pseudomonas protegens]MBP5115712.1 ABC transporter permease [Pseudomonas protegens]MBP5127069.1 ABC transporter permease [Pseudomonas protegens]POA91414.1 ABC transporter [Pseudomonas protegens]
MGALASLLQHRQILYSTVVQGLKKRTSGNVLGTLWLLLYPLLFLGMYSLVFVQILQVRIPGLGTSDYILVVFSGLVPFLAFAEAFGSGTGSIVANRDLLMNTLFPIELVVAREVLIGHTTMGMGMLLLWGAVLHFHGAHWTHLLVPLVYLLQIMMVLGLVWITATLTVFFRDLLQAIPILVLFLMMVSPIAYTADMVPEGLHALLLFNPLAWLMELYRACLMQGTIPLQQLGFFALFSTALFALGGSLIFRLKPLFADHV